MLETTKLPEGCITGTDETILRFRKPMVEKCILEDIDEIQCLKVNPGTAIKKHGHDKQWEVWVDFSHMAAYVCCIGEQHELVNNSQMIRFFMAIKGHNNYSYDDLEAFFSGLGFSVMQRSLVVND